MDMMYDIETGAMDSQISVTGMTTAERMGGGIMKASSLESLAGLLGIEDVEGFVAAVNAYNELCYGCQDGTYTCDPQFGKKAEAMIPIEGPTYYGFSGTLGEKGSAPSMVTMSGVLTDKDLCVVDIDGAPIPGLYCSRQRPGRPLRHRLLHAGGGQLDRHGRHPRSRRGPERRSVPGAVRPRQR